MKETVNEYTKNDKKNEGIISLLQGNTERKRVEDEMNLTKSNENRNRCLRLSAPVFVEEYASAVGPKEGSSHFKDGFDKVFQDPFLGKDSWEEAESELQRVAFLQLLHKARITEEEITCIFAGDLLSQTTASSYGLLSFSIPHYGIYAACSNCGAALACGAIFLSGGYGQRAAAVTSSHFGAAEKEFRFPLDYGAQRPLSATWTVTGCGAFLLNRDYSPKCKARITYVVMGEMVDSGLKDAQNMGACMAPAAAVSIASAFRELPYKPEEYDQIITGDLGEVGATALRDLLSLQGYELGDNYMDCGLMIYDREKEDVHAGGSGCGCSATILAAYILPKLESGAWKRVLFVPTGALLSKLRSEEGTTIPAIAHGVVLECCKQN